MNRSKILFAAEAAVVAAALYTVLGLLVLEAGRNVFSDEATSFANVAQQIALSVVVAGLLLLGLERARRNDGQPLPTRVPFLGLSLAGIALGVAVSMFVWGVAGKSALRREIASLEAKGLAPPSRSAAPPADAENAVVYLVKAQEALKTSLGADYLKTESFVALRTTLDRFGADGTVGAELKTATPLLEQNREALELALQATQKTAAHWSIDFSPPIALVQFPEHLQHNTLVNLLLLQAIVRAEAGDTKGAASSIGTALGLADVIGASPMHISQVFRTGVTITVLTVARQIFDTPADLLLAEAEWSKHLEPHDLLEDAKRSLQEGLLEVPREIVAGSKPQVSLGLDEAPVSTLFGPVLYFSVRNTMRSERHTFLACRPAAAGTALPRPAPRALSRAGRGAAWAALARAAIDYAKAPVLAGDSAKGIGSDPFAGAPLRLVLGSNGALVYSIGQDGVDNGGAAFNKDTDTGDISWQVHPDMATTK